MYDANKERVLAVRQFYDSGALRLCWTRTGSPDAGNLLRRYDEQGRLVSVEQCDMRAVEHQGNRFITPHFFGSFVKYDFQELGNVHVASATTGMYAEGVLPTVPVGKQMRSFLGPFPEAWVWEDGVHKHYTAPLVADPSCVPPHPLSIDAVEQRWSLKYEGKVTLTPPLRYHGKGRLLVSPDLWLEGKFTDGKATGWHTLRAAVGAARCCLLFLIPGVASQVQEEVAPDWLRCGPCLLYQTGGTLLRVDGQYTLLRKGVPRLHVDRWSKQEFVRRVFDDAGKRVWQAKRGSNRATGLLALEDLWTSRWARVSGWAHVYDENGEDVLYTAEFQRGKLVCATRVLQAMPVERRQDWEPGTRDLISHKEVEEGDTVFAVGRGLLSSNVMTQASLEALLACTLAHSYVDPVSSDPLFRFKKVLLASKADEERGSSAEYIRGDAVAADVPAHVVADAAL